MDERPPIRYPDAIRMEFIKAAMQGLCASQWWSNHTPNMLAQSAVELADATLAKARETQK